MTIDFHKDFSKRLDKLNSHQKKRVAKVLKLFEQNPHDPLLKNHALKGELQNYRAIAVGGDLRLIFAVEGNYERVVFIRVGTHNQVY